MIPEGCGDCGTSGSVTDPRLRKLRCASAYVCMREREREREREEERERERERKRERERERERASEVFWKLQLYGLHCATLRSGFQ
jgi:hypothetical protein